VLNLIANARDAMPPAGGRVTVRTETVLLSSADAKPLDVMAGRYVGIVVSDDGAGMPPEVQAQAFEPFFTTRPVGEGAGLGLAQVYGFARQSGGTATLESAPGIGTTVRILLPEATPVRSAGPVFGAASPTPTRTAIPARVLIAKDEAMVRSFAAEVLRELGHEVTEAGDGLQALRLLATVPVDVLCTDVMMPGGLTGYDVAREARARHPDLKVIYMSGYADPAAREGTAEDTPFLPKPFRPDDLARAVGRMIAT